MWKVKSFAVGHIVPTKEKGGNEKIRSNNVFLLCYLCNFKGWTKYSNKKKKKFEVIICKFFGLHIFQCKLKERTKKDKK